MFAAEQKNAAAKLNVIYKNLDFLELGETRIRNVDLTAFTVAVAVEGRTYVGVGKTKKDARCEAAEKALRHLRLWTGRDEDNKRMMLFGVDPEEEDPLDVVNRLRAAAGLPPHVPEPDPSTDPGLFPYSVESFPPYSVELDPSVDGGPNSSRENGTWEVGNSSTSGSWDGDPSHMFNSRGPPLANFRCPGADIRPPAFPIRGMFSSRPPGPIPRGPDPSAFGRDYSGGGPIRAAAFRRGAPIREHFSRDQSQVGPRRAGFGSGNDTVSALRTARGRGIASVTRGIPGTQDGSGRPENKTVPPRTARVGQFGPLVRNRVEPASRASDCWPRETPVVRPRSAAAVQTRLGNSLTRPNRRESSNRGAGQLRPIRAGLGRGYGSVSQPRPARPSESVAPPTLKNTAPETSSVGDITTGSSSAATAAEPSFSRWNPVSAALSYGPQSTVAATPPHAPVAAASSYWNQPSAPLLYGQQPTPAATAPSYLNTSAVAASASVGEQCHPNPAPAFPAATQPQAAIDYSAYYASYLQSMGMLASTGYANVPASSTASNPLSFPVDVHRTGPTLASQAVAYSNDAAAYYGAFYGMSGYADPIQSELYNYLYSYDSSKQT